MKNPNQLCFSKPTDTQVNEKNAWEETHQPDSTTNDKRRAGREGGRNFYSGHLCLIFKEKNVYIWVL